MKKMTTKWECLYYPDTEELTIRTRRGMGDITLGSLSPSPENTRTCLLVLKELNDAYKASHVKARR